MTGWLIGWLGLAGWLAGWFDLIWLACMRVRLALDTRQNIEKFNGRKSTPKIAHLTKNPLIIHDN